MRPSAPFRPVVAAALLAWLSGCPAGQPAGDLGANDPCNDTTTCGAGLVCAAGFCKVAAGGACDAERECAAPLLCDGGACKVPPGGDCGGEKPCVAAHRCEESVCRAEISLPCGDGLPCRLGLACSNGFCKVAAGGTCSGDGECTAGTRCDEGICRAPIAASCGEAVACASGAECVNGVCRVPKGGACAEPTDCAPGLVCEEGECMVPVGGVCASTDDCEGGLACDDDSTCRVPKLGDCAANDDCAGLLVCSAGECRVAVLARCAEGDCAAGLDCVGGTCVARPGGDCPTGFECGPLLTCDDGVCLGGQGAPCEAGGCAAGLSCVEGTCVGDVGSACSRESECLAALVCDGGLCRVDLNGACSDSRPCSTGYVCSEGVCRVPAQGRCDGDVCAAGLVCEGGFCRSPAGGACGPELPCTAGYVCSEGVCRRGPGQTCEATAECAVGLTCIDGVCSRPVGGQCGPGVPCAVGLTCVEGACRATAGGGCTANDECATGLVCNAGRCEAPRGGPCNLTRECAAGLICVYGTCVGDVGSPCSVTNECNLALRCEAGTCVGSEGAPCADDDQCGDGLRCARGGCRPLSPQLGGTMYVDERADVTITGNQSEDLGKTDDVGYGDGPSMVFGDFDGDAIGDLAIGAPYADPGSRTDAGRVAVIFGARDQAPGRQLDLGQANQAVVFEGKATSDYFGHALAATDFNGDGVLDLAIGAPGWDESGSSSNEGQVLVLYGGATFPRTAGSRVVDSAFLGTYTGARIVGGVTYNRLGASLASGDVNADRVGDLLVGAAGRNSTGQMSSDKYGAAYTFLGSRVAQDLPNRAVWTSGANSRITVRSTQTYFSGDNGLGGSVALGDVNGDGKDDVFVVIDEGSGTVDGDSKYGCVVMVDGTRLGATVELDGGTGYDWASQTMDLAWFNMNSTRGHLQVLAKDLTGDGRAELVFSNPEMDMVWVLKGRANFAGALVAKYGTKVFSAAHVTNSQPDGYDWALTGQRYDEVGRRIGAGDVDKDGYLDLLVAMPGFNPSTGSSTELGVVDVLFGGPALVPSAPTTTNLVSTPGHVRFQMSSAGRQLGRSLAVGDFNDDQHADVALGSSITGSSPDKGRVFVLLGGTRP